mgnify:CR=1 FL=1
MMSFNQVVFLGNVGRDSDMQETPDKTPVARFSMAVSTYAGKDESGKAKSEAMWLTVNCWRDLAIQVKKVVTKGALVLVSGRLAIRKYTDKNGQEQTSVEVVAHAVEVIMSKAKQADSEPDNEQAA